MDYFLRFRKQQQLEKQSARKERQRVKRMETALLREAETMPRGLQAYMVKLHNLTEKYEASAKARKTRAYVPAPVFVGVS